MITPRVRARRGWGPRAGVIGGFAALRQLRILQKQVSDEAERNVKRDELLDKQLKEAEAREAAGLRKQAEDVKASYAVGPDDVFGYVNNDSPRPITDITCNVMSKADAALIASPDSSAEGCHQPRILRGRHAAANDGDPHRRAAGSAVQGAAARRTLQVRLRRPDPRRRPHPRRLVHGRRRIQVQLDEYLHLVQACNDDEYKW